MIAAKSGLIAEFKTAYLQVEKRILGKVSDGVDTGLRNSNDTGISTSRLVTITEVTKNPTEKATYGDDTVLYTVKPAASLDVANAIIAQADDTMRDEEKDYNYVERLTTMPNGIVKNSTDYKSVAVYMITDKNDIKVTDLG